MNFCREEVCQEQEQDRKINLEKYFPKHHSAKVTRLSVPSSAWSHGIIWWIYVNSQLPKRKSNSVISKILQGDMIYASLYLHMNNKIEPNWSPWFCFGSHNTLPTEAAALKSIPDQIIFFFSLSKPSTGLLSLWKLNPYSLHGLQCATIYPLNSPWSSYLSRVPLASFYPSILAFFSLIQHTNLALSQKPWTALLPSRKDLPRSLCHWFFMLRSLLLHHPSRRPSMSTSHPSF